MCGRTPWFAPPVIASSSTASPPPRWASPPVIGRYVLGRDSGGVARDAGAALVKGKTMDAHVLDTSPRGIADLLDGLAQPFMETDREIAVVLTAARESLRALGYNRWAH